MASPQTYNPLSGETIYDVAVKLYKDTALGIQDILLLNPNLVIDNELYGIPILYTLGLIREKPVFTTVSRETVSVYKTISLQSVYDLAVQLYGDLSKIGNLLTLFPNLDSVITLNSEISLPDQIDPIAVYFKNNGLSVATDLLPSVPPAGDATWDRTDITWDSTFYTFDNG